MQFLDPQWVARVTSTNTALLGRIDAGAPVADGYVLATTEQTAGRGRGSRTWHAAAGRDLCCSFLLRTQAPTRQLASVAMATALGLVDCLQELGLDARTKWPNDVVVCPDGEAGGAKIAGILCELRPGVVVVGFGLNVSMSATEAQQIDQPATSILIQTGTVLAPQDILPRLLAALAPRLNTWEREGFSGLRSDWTRQCLALGQDIVIDDGDTRQQGILEGFGDAGQLLMRKAGTAPESPPVEIWSGHLRQTTPSDS